MTHLRGALPTQAYIDKLQAACQQHFQQSCEVSPSGIQLLTEGEIPEYALKAEPIPTMAHCSFVTIPSANRGYGLRLICVADKPQHLRPLIRGRSLVDLQPIDSPRMVCITRWFS